MTTALYLLGVIAIIVFWMALAIIIDGPNGKPRPEALLVQTLGSGVSIALWIIVLTYFGIK